MVVRRHHGNSPGFIDMFEICGGYSKYFTTAVDHHAQQSLSKLTRFKIVDNLFIVFISVIQVIIYL